MPRRRLLIFFGIAGILVACALILIKTPTKNSSWLPDWIAEVPPLKSDLKYVPWLAGGPTESRTENETRKMPISFEDFSLKIKKTLSEGPGWNDGSALTKYASTSPMQIWSKETPTSSQVIAFAPRGKGVIVFSVQHYKMSWLEMTHYKVRRFFGAKD